MVASVIIAATAPRVTSVFKRSDVMGAPLNRLSPRGIDCSIPKLGSLVESKTGCGATKTQQVGLELAVSDGL